MSLLDQIIALGRDLPAEIKPIVADVSDAIAGIVHTLEHHGLLPPQAAPTATPTTSAAEPGTPSPPEAAVGSPVGESPSEPPTVGSLVADAAPTGTPAPAADYSPNTTGGNPFSSYSVDELTGELARRQQEAIQQADAQKTTAEGQG